MFSYFLLPQKSCADIDTYISDLHFDLPLIMTSKKGQNIKSMKISHVWVSGKMESEHQKTYDLMPHIFFDFIFWPPEVINIWTQKVKCLQDHVRSKKGDQNGIGTPKNLWVNTSHDVFSLIGYFDHFWRSL